MSSLDSSVARYVGKQSRQQAGTAGEGGASAHKTLALVLKQHGLAGLYRGVAPKLAQSVATAAILFVAKERVYQVTKEVRFVVALFWRMDSRLPFTGRREGPAHRQGLASAIQHQCFALCNLQKCSVIETGPRETWPRVYSARQHRHSSCSLSREHALTRKEVAVLMFVAEGPV